MEKKNTLTAEARQVIVQLLVYRLRNSVCHCEILERSKLDYPCHRCRLMANAKDEFTSEYFTACELVAKRVGEIK
jgi:hypothetical protein